MRHLTVLIFSMVLGLLLSACNGKECTPSTRVMAITMDDLPPVEPFVLDKITHALSSHQATAAFFVIADRVKPDNVRDFAQLRDQGFTLGSHSYSHPSLREVSAEQYIADLEKADKILSPIMTAPKYYRYPYLAEGRLIKRKRVHQYLSDHHYLVAPVTIDSRDFEFNSELYRSSQPLNEDELADIKNRYLNFVWKQVQKTENTQHCRPEKQILMLHANRLNSYFLGDLLQMLANRGYRFISLDEAMNKA